MTELSNARLASIVSDLQMAPYGRFSLYLYLSIKLTGPHRILYDSLNSRLFELYLKSSFIWVAGFHSFVPVMLKSIIEKIFGGEI